jgi:hypothetical protein
LEYPNIMKRIAVAFLAILAGCAAPQPGAPQGVAEELAGRTAGAPQRCVQIVRDQGLRVSETDRHTLIYGGGSTVFANRLGPGCGFARNDVLVLEPVGSSYCRGDIVRSFDAQSRIPGPSCILGDFTPYTRP